jgi:aminoglycoside phosphotransferase (APT) family kinase protein
MSEVPGRSFTRVMIEGRARAFTEVGRALAELHQVPAAPMRAWSPQKEYDELQRHMDGAKRALPDLAPRLDRLLHQLARGIPFGGSHYAPIHGNLFGDQILYDEAAEPGRRVGIVDWDAWCYGDPHFDLGRLIAHLLYLARVEGLSQEAVSDAIQAFLKGYREVAGAAAIDPPTLAWHVAIALLLQARISLMRKLVPDWPRHFDIITAEAADIANEKGIVARAAPVHGRLRAA